jgi:hypothetical protein
VDLVVAFG